MENKINLGIIGRNFGYNVIYKSFLKNKKYNIKGFSFKSKKIKKVQIPKKIKIYSNWKKLILDKEINAVVIATPPKLHKNIIKYAVRNNKHIFCEKPFTCSYKEANSISRLIKTKKNIAHMVNYEFTEIDAFLHLKKKIINKINIERINLNWFININKRSKNNWKESHSKGGGIIFNYICHSIYYLEFLLGKINSIKTKIFTNKDKIKILKGSIFFKNNLPVQLNIKVGSIKDKIKPIHQLKVVSNKKTYLLKTNLNTLSDKFSLIEIDKDSNKIKNVIVMSKNNNQDFRVGPTFNNSKKFSGWILNGVKQSPNFLDAKRVHFVINKIMESSKKSKKIYI